MRFADLVKHVKADKKRSPRLEHVTLFTNPGWRPNKLDCTPKGGIAPTGPTANQAQRAVARRFVDEVQAGDRLSPREWIRREKGKRAEKVGEKRALGKLAADLLGVDFGAPGLAKNKGFLALRRSLERSGAPVKAGRKEEHQTIKNPEYREMIARLPGGEAGNPFAPDAVLIAARLAAGRVEFKVRGDWKISQETKYCHAFTTKMLQASDEIEGTSEQGTSGDGEIISHRGLTPYQVLTQSPEELIALVGVHYAAVTGVEVVLLKLRAIEIIGEFAPVKGNGKGR